MDTITIADRPVGGGHPPLIIAEVAQAHEGSLGMAHSYIDAAARAGAGAVKFQTHVAEHESTRSEPFRIRLGAQDKTRYDYWKRMEFSEEQWAGLAQHAREKGLTFLSSAFSLHAVELLHRLGMPAWKVGSGEARSREMIQAMARTGRPILLSTGMSPWADIDATVRDVKASGAPLALFQCSSIYPTPLEKVGLNMIDALRARYSVPVGLSDHSGSVFPGLAALARGADMLEVHVVFDRGLFGPDATSSVTFGELSTLAEAAKAFSTLDRHPVEKDAVAGELAGMRGMFGRSVAPARPLKAGTVLGPGMLAAKKPGTGIPCERRDSLFGKRLKRDVSPDQLLSEEDLDG
ncbi:MAG: N-acetylneuraminate synthase family protein [Elusimicrobia bacterium]|nr:N-acetylneuraminate synthase family protein [Elusimicrobiota bacterium]